jgi:hypothetical protein
MPKIPSISGKSNVKCPRFKDSKIQKFKDSKTLEPLNP